MLQSLARRKHARGLVLLAPALALIAVLLPAVAGTVLGHHATVNVQLACDGNVTYKLYDWTDNNANHQAEATLTVSYQLNGTGSWTSLGTISFTSSNYDSAYHNGIAGTPFNPGDATSVTIRAVASTWGDGGSGGTYTATATRSTTCPKHSPSVSTVASPNSGTVGVAITAGDTATVTGGFAMDGQSVSFRLYDNSSCSGSSILSGSATISSGTASYSHSWTPTSVDTYYWRVSYAGNTYNNSFNACGGANETIVINKASPTISTVASPNSGTVGVAITAGDTGTVSGGYSMNGQSVTFGLYAASNCSGSAIISGNATINSGTASYSHSWTPTAAGTYYWKVSYAGDSKNNSYSACGGATETVTIGPKSPSMSTVASPSTGTVGVAMTAGDTATVTGGYSMNGQTVSFGLFDNAVCSGSPVISGNGTIGSGTASFSTGWTPQAAGTYYWKVAYAGNANNNPYSACGGANETVTIGPGSPSISTVASPNVGTVGAAMTAGDTATVSGGFSLDGQTVSFGLFDNAVCSGSPVISGSGTITSGSASFSTSWTPQAVGTYYWKVAYAGDTNNNPFSACGGTGETVVIGSDSPTIATVASPSTGTVGVAMTAGDTATVSGGFSLNGQTVSFGLFDNDSCSGTALIGGNATISSGTATFSTSWTPSSVGIYYWSVSYAGDAANDPYSECGGANETVTIGTNSPRISTVASPNTGTVGVAMTAGDTATVSGGLSLDGQTVSFGLYADNECSGSAILSGTGTISSGTASFSTSWTPSSVGTYYWKVAYAGDAANDPYSECGGANETVTIGQTRTAITTVLSASTASVGTVVHDTATLSGTSGDASGTVTYTVYGNSQCTLNAIDAGTVNVTNGVVPNSNGIQFNSVGTWYWQAVYSGDAKNAGATSACTEEVLTIQESASPYESVGGETGTPGVTTPPTSTGDGSGRGATPLAALLIAMAFASLGLLTVEVQRRRFHR